MEDQQKDSASASHQEQSGDDKQDTQNVPNETNVSDEDNKEKSGREHLADDLVDETLLKAQEELLSEDQLQERYGEAKNYKNEGNNEFGRQEFREAIFTYTRGLLVCPLKEKEFRSILYSNRSAAKIKLGMKQSAIEDCTKSLDNKPDYVRALLRRAKLYEETDKLDEALKDYNKVLELDPSVSDARAAAQRLPGQIHERNEKMKAEMMEKLKDLGNMVLRPFGLSTNNFQLQQNQGGGYSVNFNK